MIFPPVFCCIYRTNCGCNGLGMNFVSTLALMYNFPKHFNYSRLLKKERILHVASVVKCTVSLFIQLYISPEVLQTLSASECTVLLFIQLRFFILATSSGGFLYLLSFFKISQVIASAEQVKYAVLDAWTTRLVWVGQVEFWHIQPPSFSLGDLPWTLLDYFGRSVFCFELQTRKNEDTSVEVSADYLCLYCRW